MAKLLAALQGLFGVCMRRTIVIGGRELRIIKQLAEGGFSFVSLVEDVATGERFAVKQILCQDAAQKAAARAEIQVHQALVREPGILQLLAHSFATADGAAAPGFGSAGDDGRAEKAYLLFPFVEGGSLEDYVATRRGTNGPYLDEKTTLSLFLDVARSLQRLHAQRPPIAHRDLCPRNIMLEKKPGSAAAAAASAVSASAVGRPILIDLGSACPGRVRIASRIEALRLQEQAATHSSMPYRAPELWDPPVTAAASGSASAGAGAGAAMGTAGGAGGEWSVTEKTDVWSLAASIYCAAFGYSPFESTRGEDGQLRQAECTHLMTLRDGVQFPESAFSKFSPGFRELITWMLCKDPVLRPSVEEVVARLQGLLRAGVAGAGGAAGGAGAAAASTGAGAVSVSVEQ